MAAASETATQAGGRPRRRNRRGEGGRLREDLLGAGEAILAETHDPSAVSLRSVALRVGVAVTSVYLHFDSAETLKRALAQRCFADFTTARAAAADQIADPARRLLAGCRAYADYGLRNPGRYRLMFGPELAALTHQAIGSPAPTPGAPLEPSRASFAALVGAVTGCQQAGLASPGDPVLVALLVWTTLHGQVTLRLDRPGYPWPPLRATVTEAVTRIVGLPAHEVTQHATVDRRWPTGPQ
jgi:AcrR family transcriptional regulator